MHELIHNSNSSQSAHLKISESEQLLISELNTNCPITEPVFIQKISEIAFKLCKSKKWEELESLLGKFAGLSADHPERCFLLANSCNNKSQGLLLHYACLNKAPDRIIKMLISLGTDLSGKIDIRIDDLVIPECSFLHLALCCNNKEAVAALLMNGHAVDVKNGREETPAMLYIKMSANNKLFNKNCSEMFGLLSSYGDNFESRDTEGFQIIHYCVKNRLWELGEIVSKTQAEHAKKSSSTALEKSEVQSLALATAVNSEKPELLLEQFKSLLTYAKQDGEKGREKLVNNCTEIIWQLTNKAVETKEWKHLNSFLLKIKNEPELFTSNAAKLILDTFSNDGETPLLHVLCKNFCPIETLKTVLELGADINIIAKDFFNQYFQSEDGKSALHVCDKSDNLDAANLLLSAGIDTEIVNSVNKKAFAERFISMNPALVNQIDEIINYPELLKLYGKINKMPENPAEWTFPANPLYFLKFIALGYKSPLFATGSDKKFLNADELKKLGLLDLLDEKLIKNISNPDGQVDSSFITDLLIKAKDFKKLKEMALRGYSLPKGYLKGNPDQKITDLDIISARAELLADLEVIIPLVDSKNRRYHGYTHHPLLDISSSINQIMDTSGDIRDAAALARIWHYLAYDSGELNNGKYLAEFLPKLLHNYSPDLLAPIMYAIEYGMSGISGKRAQSNLTEFFALLAHNDISDQTMNIFTSSLSSIDRYINYGITVNGRMINLWTKAANLSLGFKRFRFESDRNYTVNDDGKRVVSDLSLFEYAGMRRIKGDGHFGSRYVLFGRSAELKYMPKLIKNSALRSLIDPDSVLIVQRGCYILAHPENGITIIRNSSLRFGRDILKFPCYHSSKLLLGKNITWTEVANLTPERIEGKEFENILDHSLYPHNDGRRSSYYPSNKSNMFIPAGSIEEIEANLTNIENALSGVTDWIFDTKVNTAWGEKDGKDILVGAFNSPGFKHLVKSLRTRFEEAKSDELWYGESKTIVPALELHRKYHPPFSPYARLLINEETLGVLEYIVENGWNPPEQDTEEPEITEDEPDLNENEFDSSGIYEFFQKALSDQADLLQVAY